MIHLLNNFDKPVVKSKKILMATFYTKKEAEKFAFDHKDSIIEETKVSKNRIKYSLIFNPLYQTKKAPLVEKKNQIT